MGYSFRLAARVLLYALSHRQDSTYHSLCYTSHGALAGTRNNSMGTPGRIDPMIHCTMSGHSYHGATSRSFGSLRGIDPRPTAHQMDTLYTDYTVCDITSVNYSLYLPVLVYLYNTHIKLSSLPCTHYHKKKIRLQYFNIITTVDLLQYLLLLHIYIYILKTDIPHCVLNVKQRTITSRKPE